MTSVERVELESVGRSTSELLCPSEGGDETYPLHSEIELSIVMPCLNEADTLATCVRKAQRVLREESIVGEIVVADNGSTDGSIEIALALGVRVVHVKEPGYGSALMGGIDASRGVHVIMGDADDSYDWLEIPKFLDHLRQGCDLVQGCRFPTGGGAIAPGAMPALHRWIGNPLFSLMARRWFGAKVHDIYCGMRGFRRDAYARLDQRCTGMEFATEMIIKASLLGMNVDEVPITLHPDGRQSHAPHLKTFRDGWRTLRFFLMYSPRWLFLFPGIALIVLGLIGFAIAMPGIYIGRLGFDAHTLLFASLAILCGYQSVLFAVFAREFAASEGLIPGSVRLKHLLNVVSLEKGLLLGTAAALVGIVLLLAAINQWRMTDFGRLDYSKTMRWVIPGATLTALGVQTMFASFFLSILGMHRR
jgi:glycosyltransferase involved in cell wall biosynthesis